MVICKAVSILPPEAKVLLELFCVYSNQIEAVTWKGRHASVHRVVTNSGVSRVWQAWHVPWAPLSRGCENCLAKIKFVMYSFLNLYLAPHATIKQRRCINTTPSYNARRVAQAPSISALWQNCGIVTQYDPQTL